MKQTVFILLILLFGKTVFAQIPVRDVSHINAPTKLNGEWGFAEGKALLPSQTNTLTHTLYLPQYLEGRKNGAVGVATFVLDLKTTPNKPLSIDFNPLVNAWKLFADDRLVCESGIIEPENNIYVASPSHKIASFVPKSTKTRLTLWVANSQHRHFGISISPQIAPTGILEESHAKRANFDWAILGVLIGTGLYHLGLFFAWRRDKAPLWFGLFIITFAARIATTSEKIASSIFQSMSWDILTRAEYISGYLTLPLFILYIGSLYPKQSIKNIERINLGIGIVFVILALFTSTLFFTSTLPITEIIIVQSLIFVSWILYRAFIAKEPNSTFALITFIIFSGTVLHDLLMFSNIIDDTHDWAEFGLIFYLFAQAVILLQRYANTFHTLKKHEETLESIIVERTSELKDLLSQRELLMRELSHRVKNNLQFIIGLLWTKRSKANDETQEILLTLQSQIQAIAKVHETLCEQPNITILDGGKYLETIMNALRELYSDINFVFSCETNGYISMDDTISLGLVVSEMVSNSVKHAYKAQKGTVSLTFKVENNWAKMTYSDGKTTFENNDFIMSSQNTKRIGWSMITELLRQLKAQTSSEEYIFTIHFPVEKIL
ncbi:MAG: 7TM diverse intracellular signaling domain-containing protein [Sulfuricurvum sp.]|nr:7TM diverse intracellular signaling domain-containing protein [Sulfuricurvum sp.]